MNAWDRWLLFKRITDVFLIFFRFGMWVKHLPKGPLRAGLFLFGIPSAVISSVVYNWTIAVIIYAQFPRLRDVMFTWRTQHNYSNRAGLRSDRLAVTMEVVRILNQIDPGHIKTEGATRAKTVNKRNGWTNDKPSHSRESGQEPQSAGSHHRCD